MPCATRFEIGAGWGTARLGAAQRTGLAVGFGKSVQVVVIMAGGGSISLVGSVSSHIGQAELRSLPCS